ncbi:3-isopropylmalate dehydratase small subunit [Anaerosolibacter sp.]|uniref:LeuD/DmdB family oxidoreductase small subunit n=1 Tax=Anaerosolibacter sp. TaxID=1872527 RepID=UPI0039F12950
MVTTKKIEGRVWKFGDNINTDIISPPQYMELSIEEASKHAMSTISPDFAKSVQRGDIMVAGNNFGSGSSRETSPLTLKHLGVGAIIAKSFARIFYRNAINVGILVVESSEADRIQDGDQIEIDYHNGFIKNVTKEEMYECSKIPQHIMDIINVGGFVSYLKQSKRDYKRR